MKNIIQENEYVISFLKHTKHLILNGQIKVIHPLH